MLTKCALAANEFDGGPPPPSVAADVAATFKRASRSLKAAATSINEDEHRRILCQLHHVFKLPVNRDRRFELG
jgi:hypothetical protein